MRCQLPENDLKRISFENDAIGTEWAFIYSLYCLFAAIKKIGNEWSVVHNVFWQHDPISSF